MNLSFSRTTRRALVDAIATGVWPAVAAWVNGPQPDCPVCRDLWTSARRRCFRIARRGAGAVLAVVRLDGDSARIIPTVPGDGGGHVDGKTIRAEGTCAIPTGIELVDVLALGQCACAAFVLRRRRDWRSPQCSSCRRARSAGRRVTKEQSARRRREAKERAAALARCVPPANRRIR